MQDLIWKESIDKTLENYLQLRDEAMKDIFAISVEDVQYLAKKKVGRELTIEELERVQKGVEFGLECWEGVVIAAIEELK